MTDKQTRILLFAIQGVGAVFVGIFLAAYLGGLPTTAVLHSEPAFRIPLTIIGVVFVALIVCTLLAAFLRKQRD